ncbi:Gfo/Idh/MocA family protein [Photobacterium kasasachensis]|uniref:Gfo/Idh/MocA family protein n=1 Tax=Photobacterium kasasachensis TaxID=2910240 RepID=UPI003D09B2B6
MSQTLQWGILGTSFISGIMADAINKEGNTRIHAVAGRTLPTLEQFAQDHDIETVTSDFDAVIEDSNVDVIYIALPNHLHHEYIIKAANAGKAILCEKSLSVDMEKTAESLAAVEQNNVFFMEGLMYLHHPFTIKILEMLDSGIIGEVRSIQGHYCASIAQFVNPGSKGALYNLGCYPASLLHLVMQHSFGSQVFDNYTLTAHGRRGNDGNICESAATLHFNNGVVCQLHTAEDYGLQAGFTILGTEGCIQLKSSPWLPEATGNQLIIQKYEQQEEIVEIDADGDAFLYQVRKTREYLEAGLKQAQRPAAQPTDSYQIMELLTRWEQATVCT